MTLTDPHHHTPHHNAWPWQTFERLVVSKEEALELFKYNAFKAAIITSKIPDGGFTTVYRNGDLIDLCRCVRCSGCIARVSVHRPSPS